MGLYSLKKNIFSLFLISLTMNILLKGYKLLQEQVSNQILFKTFRFTLYHATMTFFKVQLMLKFFLIKISMM